MAQSQSHEARLFPGAVAVDNSGNVYLGGNFSGDADIGSAELYDTSEIYAPFLARTTVP